MKITIVNGSLPHYDHGLNKVIKVLTNTLTELGVQLDEVNLGFSQIPYFDGMRAQATDDIVARLRTSAGVIFACTTQLFSPGSIMHTFLEFLECPEYRDALHEKYCLLATISKEGGERSTLEYMARAVHFLGGFESGRIGLQEIHTRSIMEGAESPIQDIIEKAGEDFYRAVRQNRKYIVPMDAVSSPIKTTVTAPVTQRVTSYVPPTVQSPSYTPPVSQQPSYNPPVSQQPSYTSPVSQSPSHAPSASRQPFQQPPQEPVQSPLSQMQHKSQEPIRPTADQLQNRNTSYKKPVETVIPNLNLDTFTERQEQDIKELTALFSQKFVQPEEPQPRHQPGYPPMYQQPLSPQQPQMPGYQQPTPKPRVKTIKQITQSLPHYFQPQMSSGLTAIIQFSISGAEAFDGYLTIIDSECEYTEGIAENPEITIISDSNTWHDVLKGKHTAQKAFMIGGLKVRGNFSLLTKFDSLFKF